MIRSFLFVPGDSERKIEKAGSVIFKDGWLDRVFAPEAVRASVADICRSTE